MTAVRKIMFPGPRRIESWRVAAANHDVPEQWKCHDCAGVAPMFGGGNLRPKFATVKRRSDRSYRQTLGARLRNWWVTNILVDERARAPYANRLQLAGSDDIATVAAFPLLWDCEIADQ
jgi:hypothetical protein